jgi:hypothetical protein
MIKQGKLQMHWSFSTDLHKRASIEWLGHEFVAALQAMVTSGRSRERSTLRAEDFPEASLDHDEFATLLRQLCVESKEGRRADEPNPVANC